MKTLITAALISIYGFAWAQNSTAPLTSNTPSVPTATTTVPTVNLPATTNNQNNQVQQSATIADKIRQENQANEQSSQQALREQDARRVNRPNQTVCLQNDSKCLADEARSRVNQNNGTRKDNPTDLNNRPTY